MTTTENNGYPLPDTIDPGALRCVKTYIPDDPEYIAAFWAAYEHFTKWLAWERTGDSSGAQAALIWLDCFRIARAEFVAGHPCDQIPEPQYEEGEGEEELADFLWANKVIIEQMDTLLDAGSTYAVFIQWHLETFGVYPAQSWRPLWDHLDGLSSAQRDADIAAVPWEYFYDGVYCEAKMICEDGGYIERFYCWASAVIDATVDTAQDLSDDILEASAEAWETIHDALLFGSITPFSAEFHGYGENWEFDTPICFDWYKDFDFTTDDYDFVIQDYAGGPGGTWVSGVGFKGLYYGTQGSNGAYRVYARSPIIDDTYVEKVAITLTFDSGEEYFRVVQTRARKDGVAGGYWTNIVTYTPPGPLPTSGTYEDEASHQIDELQIYVANIHQGSPQPAQGAVGDLVVSRVQAWGSGTNPW
jgi:hypothetical protein